MARVLLSNHLKLAWLLLRSGARRLSGRATGHPLARWPLPLLRAERLLIAPQDLRTADTTQAGEIYSGRFAFAGKVVLCDSRSIFAIEPPSEEWAVELFGFGWLRHLRAAESAITRANGRALVDEWMRHQGGWHPLAWRPDVLSRRIISWLSQATLVLQDADLAFYRRFLRSLMRQVRYLRHTAGDARRGVAHLIALVAVTQAALCTAGQGRRVTAATDRLSRELQRQIRPDGGHIGRNPGSIIELLLDLLPLRQAYAARNLPPPQALVHAIDRMMPMLRFFCHSDGSFARFNGMAATPADLLLTLTAYDENGGAPLSNAPHSGYLRLEGGGAVLIMDVGQPPPLEVSLEAHAGCLSFEFSTPRLNPLIVNCGMPPTGREDWRQMARSTAAHSTVTLNDASSAQFITSPLLRRLVGGSPIVRGPGRIELSRQDRSDGIEVRASHDGYVDRFGFVHARTLMLAADGTRLEGEDALLPGDPQRQPRGKPDRFAVRFHLHPSVKPTRLTDGHGAMLMMPNREIWTFNSTGGRVELEDSVYLAGSEGPRRTVQLVIYGNARESGRVGWTLQQAGSPGAAKTAAARRMREAEPKLPL